MSISSWPNKDPNEVLDYTLDWSARIETDSISASTWINLTSNGIVVDSSSFTTDTTTVWFSAGTLDLSYTITNRITTDAGRVMDQSAKIKIKAK